MWLSLKLLGRMLNLQRKIKNSTSVHIKYPDKGKHMAQGQLKVCARVSVCKLCLSFLNMQNRTSLHKSKIHNHKGNLKENGSTMVFNYSSVGQFKFKPCF